MTNDYYVYEWIRLDTNEPFYVGMGHGKRCYQLTRGSNHHFNNIVKSIPVAVNILHDNLDRQTAFDLEVWYIREYRDIIGYESICNINDGGEGNTLCGELNPMYGKNPREGKTEEELKEWNRKNSESHKGLQVGEKNGMYGKGYLVSGENHYMYGKHHSEETKKKIRIANLGKHLTDETKQKISENNAWKGKKRPEHSERMKGKNNPMYEKNPWDYMSEETKKEKSKKMSERMSGKNNPRTKAVICLTTKRIFLTVKEGAKYYKIKGDANISKCCKGELKSAGKLPNGTKLVWRYLVWNHNRKYYIKER